MVNRPDNLFIPDESQDSIIYGEVWGKIKEHEIKKSR